MSVTLIFTAIIVIVIYFYMRHNSKRNRAENINSVQQYHDDYIRRRTQRTNRHSTNGTYRRYVTKYNSTEDYRERKGQ